MNVLGEIKRVTVGNNPAPSGDQDKTLGKINDKKLAITAEGTTMMGATGKGTDTSSVKEEQGSTEENMVLQLQEILESKMSALEQKMADQLQSQIKQKDSQFEQEREVFSQQVSESKELIDSLKQELAEKETALQEAKAQEQKLLDIYKLHGQQGSESVTKNVNFNHLTTTDSDNPVGILNEVLSIVDKSLMTKFSAKGHSYQAHDYKDLDNFVAQNQAQVMLDLEKWGKKNGLFQGDSTFKGAATVGADIEGGFLKTLSSLARNTHIPGFIFWQFADTVINFEKRMGTTVQIHRSRYSPASTDENDWLLSGLGTYAPITSTTQNVETGVVEATLLEWGMGKAGTVNTPISIPNFVMAYSMIDLMAIVTRNIVYNYNQWLDLKIRNLWKPTSAVVYNDGGRVTSTATDVDTGDLGTMNSQFLINLFSYMHTQQVRTYMDGCYGLAVHPVALAQLKSDLETKQKWQAVTERDLLQLVNILQPSTNAPIDTGRISGYQGKYYGFHIFETNATSVGAAGTEGVRNETLGAGPGSTLTRTSYAFGSNSIGRGIGDPMEIRSNEVTDFGRKNDYIWTSSEGYVALDVDPTGYSDVSNVPQQLRVFDVRTLDAEV